jgi:hypothetical protein
MGRRGSYQSDNKHLNTEYAAQDDFLLGLNSEDISGFERALGQEGI